VTFAKLGVRHQFRHPLVIRSSRGQRDTGATFKVPKGIDERSTLLFSELTLFESRRQDVCDDYAVWGKSAISQLKTAREAVVGNLSAKVRECTPKRFSMTAFSKRSRRVVYLHVSGLGTV
jgi:hypothetical protein